MTIRTAMLRAFLALVAGAVLLSGALALYELRQALQGEIERNLRTSAVALLGRVDAFFRERLEDVREWDRLEFLEDLRVGDLDKRLARLLADLKAGHGGIYRSLYCTDLEGRVVAASDPARVGAERPPGQPQLEDPDGAVVLERLVPVTPKGPERAVLRARIASRLGGGPLGYLYAEVDWSDVGGFLDQTVTGTHRSVLLVGADGRTIAGAGPLTEIALARGTALAGWANPAGSGADVRTRDGLAPGTGQLLVGSASSADVRQPGDFGWHLYIVEPTRIAFAPVWHLTWITLGALLAVLALAGWIAVMISGRIARPIVELTNFARGLDLGREPQPPRVESTVAEVGELNRAFGDMLDALEHSRGHLIRAGKLAVVGEMAAIMAHEVRTPLGILKSSAQLLERRAGATPAERELTGFIASETERLNRLVTTLIECASPRAPRFDPHDLHAILDHALGLVATKAERLGIEVRVETGASDSVVACDREQILQVFLNLVINAVQHVPNGGHIRAATADAGDLVEVRVEDDGPGIPEADLPRLYDPFFTRREGGVGLGLTIVQQIVQAHGGEIAAGGGTLGGARFTIRLPRRHPGATP